MRGESYLNSTAGLEGKKESDNTQPVTGVREEKSRKEEECGEHSVIRQTRRIENLLV
jgi:hypothetical protein